MNAVTELLLEKVAEDLGIDKYASDELVKLALWGEALKWGTKILSKAKPFLTKSVEAAKSAKIFSRGAKTVSHFSHEGELASNSLKAAAHAELVKPKTIRESIGYMLKHPVKTVVGGSKRRIGQLIYTDMPGEKTIGKHITSRILPIADAAFIGSAVHGNIAGEKGKKFNRKKYDSLRAQSPQLAAQYRALTKRYEKSNKGIGGLARKGGRLTANLVPWFGLGGHGFIKGMAAWTGADMLSGKLGQKYNDITHTGLSKSQNKQLEEINMAYARQQAEQKRLAKQQAHPSNNPFQ